MALALRPKEVYCYLVTIKCTNYRYTAKSEINCILAYVRLRLPQLTEYSDIYAWELDKLKRWHVHFIIHCQQQPYFKNLRKKNYTIYFQSFPIKDSHRVRNYLNKVDQCEAFQQQLNIESYAYYHDLFTDEQ